MSFKSFSTAQAASGNAKPDDKSKSAPAAKQPDKAPAEAAPAPKA